MWRMQQPGVEQPSALAGITQQPKDTIKRWERSITAAVQWAAHGRQWTQQWDISVQVKGAATATPSHNSSCSVGCVKPGIAQAAARMRQVAVWLWHREQCC